MVKQRSDVSASEPDWSRESKQFWEWAPGKSLLQAIRTYQRHRNSQKPLHIALRIAASLRHRFWSVVSGADIPLNCQLGGGLLIPHPNGIVIHPHAQLGPNCLVFQQVTIGTRFGGEPPMIGGHVDIGAGAKVLGAVHLGDHVCVGANAVVLTDVPSHASVVGIPGRIIGPRDDIHR